MRTLKITSILMLTLIVSANLVLAQTSDKKAGKKKDKTLIDTTWVAPKPTEDVVDVPKLKDSIAVLKDGLFEAEHFADSIGKENYKLEGKIIELQADNYRIQKETDSLRLWISENGKKQSTGKKVQILKAKADSLEKVVTALQADNYALQKDLTQKPAPQPKEVIKEVVKEGSADRDCEEKNVALLEENRVLSKTNVKLQAELGEAKKSAPKDSKQPAVVPKEQKEPSQNCTELVEKVEKLLKRDSTLKENEILSDKNKLQRDSIMKLQTKTDACSDALLNALAEHKYMKSRFDSLVFELSKNKNDAETYRESFNLYKKLWQGVIDEKDDLQKEVEIYRKFVPKSDAEEIRKEAKAEEKVKTEVPAEKTEKKEEKREEKREETKKEEKDPWADINE